MDSGLTKSETSAPLFPGLNWSKALISNPRGAARRLEVELQAPVAYMDFTDPIDFTGPIDRRRFLLNGVSRGVPLMATPRKTKSCIVSGRPSGIFR